MRPALFLHIQKTAGTAIQDAARSHFGNENVASHGDFATIGREGCAKLPFVSGHFGFDFARPLMPERFCFTVLRDPIDRLISLYTFCASRDTDDRPIYAAACRTNLEGFLRLSGQSPYRRFIWNNQVWQLASGFGGDREIDDFAPDELLQLAKRNLDQFDYVGFVATFDYDAARIFRAIGMKQTRPKRVNVSSSKPDPSDLSPSTMHLLLKNTELDRELYSYAWRRYAVARTWRRAFSRIGLSI